MMFGVDGIQNEEERLQELGMKFTMKLKEVSNLPIAGFDDTCGNLSDC